MVKLIIIKMLRNKMFLTIIKRITKKIITIRKNRTKTLMATIMKLR